MDGTQDSVSGLLEAEGLGEGKLLAVDGSVTSQVPEQVKGAAPSTSEGDTVFASSGGNDLLRWSLPH